MTYQPYSDDEARIRALFDDVIGHDLPVAVDLDRVVGTGRRRSRLRQTLLAAFGAVLLAGGLAAAGMASGTGGAIGPAGRPGQARGSVRVDDESTAASRRLSAEVVRLTGPARAGQIVTDSQPRDPDRHDARLAQLDVTVTYLALGGPVTENLQVTVARPGPGVTSVLRPCDGPKACVVDRVDGDGTVRRVYPYDPAATGTQPGWLAVVVKPDGLEVAVSDTVITGDGNRPRYPADRLLKLAGDVHTRI